MKKQNRSPCKNLNIITLILLDLWEEYNVIR